MDALQLAINALEASSYGITVYGGALPENIDPTSNPVVVVHSRGGTTHPEMPISDMSIMVTCWAGMNQFKLARALYGQVFRTLHGITDMDFGVDGCIIRCIEELPGQDVTDPDAGYATVVSAYTMMIRESASQTSPTSVPGFTGAGRHTPAETPDGIRTVFTFQSIPLDPTLYLLVINGLVTDSGFTQTGNTLQFDDPLPIGSSLFAYY
jgi:hypothetical protein